MTINNNSRKRLLNLTNILWLYFFITVAINIPYVFMTKSYDSLLLAKGMWNNILLFYAKPTLAQIIRLWNIGAIGVSFTIIVLGIKRLRKAHGNSQSFCMVIVGTCICVLFFVSYLFMYAQTKQLSMLVEADIISILEKKLKDNELNRSKRVYVEQALAREIYIKEDRLITISDERGNQFVFKPSDEDKTAKKNYDYVKRVIPKNKITAKRGMVLWASILVLSIVLGILLRYRDIRDKTKGSPP